MNDRPTPRHRYIETAWRRYRDHTVPTLAGDVQVRETRKAFFAGAAILHTLIMENQAASDNVTDDELQAMVAKLEDILDEIREFDLSLHIEETLDEIDDVERARDREHPPSGDTS